MDVKGGHSRHCLVKLLTWCEHI